MHMRGLHTTYIHITQAYRGCKRGGCGSCPSSSSCALAHRSWAPDASGIFCCTGCEQGWAVHSGGSGGDDAWISSLLRVHARVDPGHLLWRRRKRLGLTEELTEPCTPVWLGAQKQKDTRVSDRSCVWL